VERNHAYHTIISSSRTGSRLCASQKGCTVLWFSASGSRPMALQWDRDANALKRPAAIRFNGASGVQSVPLAGRLDVK
jgi:hypothetical protein